MYWLIGRNSKLSLENKTLLYKTTISQSGRKEWKFGDAPENPIFP
jgi:hypothetical protein